MKKNIFVIGIIVVSVFIFCNKNKDLYGDKISSGRLFVINDITGDGLPKILANTEIRLSFSGNNPATSYDRSTNSDINGYYFFNNLPNKNLKYYSQTSNGDIVYSLNDSIDSPKANLDFYLKANPDYLKGVVVTVSDKSDGRISKLRVGMYSSKILALSDTCYQYTTPLSSNEYGKVFFKNIPIGLHYLKVIEAIGAFKFKGFDSICVSGKLDYLVLKVNY